MSRTETRRVDISCTRDKNVLHGESKSENGSVAENPRTTICLTRDIRERKAQTFENQRRIYCTLARPGITLYATSLI